MKPVNQAIIAGSLAALLVIVALPFVGSLLPVTEGNGLERGDDLVIFIGSATGLLPLLFLIVLAVIYIASYLIAFQFFYKWKKGVARSLQDQAQARKDWVKGVLFIPVSGLFWIFVFISIIILMQ